MGKFLASVATAVLLPADIVDLQGNDIRISDVVDMDTISETLGERIGDKVLATVPHNKSHLELDRADITRLVRLRVPALENVSTQSGSITFIIPQNLSKEELVCFETAGELSRGHPLTQSDLLPTQCLKGHALNVLKYERHSGVTRTNRNLTAGSYLGRLSLPEGRFADIQDSLLLEVKIGNVRIQRKVEALQPALGERRIFVRDAQGHVLSVPLEISASGVAPNE